MKLSQCSAALALAVMISQGQIVSAYAEYYDTSLILQPHCTEIVRSQCAQYSVQDASSLKTEKMAVGDILDLDIVLRSSEPKNVETVRAWLTFDAKVLEARSVEFTDAVKAPLPGEKNIENSMGLVKIGGTIGGTVQSSEQPIARVTFRVVSAAANTTVAFQHYLPDGSGETAVNGKEGIHANSRGGTLPAPPCFDKILGCKPVVTPLLTVEPSKLLVTLIDTTNIIPIATATSPVDALAIVDTQTPVLAQDTGLTPTAIAAVSPTVSAVTDKNSTFTLLQVQNVRITTRDRDVYIGWNPLKSSTLKGYNVYYSTVSGRYAQRHTLPKEAQSYVLRDLEPGSTYFVGIRAFDGTETESAFSQEVSVTVGKPETSTAPMSSTVADDTTHGNPIETRHGEDITGETGVSTMLFAIALVSAVIGTGFAFHRQTLLHRSQYHV